MLTSLGMSRKGSPRAEHCLLLKYDPAAAEPHRYPVRTPEDGPLGCAALQQQPSGGRQRRGLRQRARSTCAAGPPISLWLSAESVPAGVRHVVGEREDELVALALQVFHRRGLHLRAASTAGGNREQQKRPVAQARQRLVAGCQKLAHSSLRVRLRQLVPKPMLMAFYFMPDD